ncbi:MAG: DUF1080 domain-containing protein [Verrucomicrobia bacterium]|nr:DUF1080 domain-containing protein [Verrucomicrobiota bacterium]
MKSPATLLTCTAFILLATLGLALRGSAAPNEPALKAIFNGKDLAGWTVAPAPNVHWRVENGVLIGESDEKRTGSMLWTERSYKDFVLELDVRWHGAKEDIDSGVTLRKPSFQVQMGTSRSLQRDMTGSMLTDGVGHPTRYPEAGRAKDWEKYFKVGGWNTFRIEARGHTFKVWINGHQTTEYTDPKWAGAAPLGLQFHDAVKMKLEFRNIRLAEL